VKEKAAKDVIRKRTLIGDALEFTPVLRVCLDAQASREDELADCSAETGKEGIERKIPDNNAIKKLQRSNNNQKSHEGINELNPLRRAINVILPYSVDDLLGFS